MSAKVELISVLADMLTMISATTVNPIIAANLTIGQIPIRATAAACGIMNALAPTVEELAYIRSVCSAQRQSTPAVAANLIIAGNHTTGQIRTKATAAGCGIMNVRVLTVGERACTRSACSDQRRCTPVIARGSSQ